MKETGVSLVYESLWGIDLLSLLKNRARLPGFRRQDRLKLLRQYSVVLD